MRSMLFETLFETCRATRLFGVFAIGLALGGCGSMVSSMPVIGMPDDAPARRETREFMPIHETRPTRDETMTAADRAKIQQELAAARERQSAAAAGR